MQFKAKDLALTCIFASLYALLSLVSLFPIIGSVGRFITLAAVLAPVMGILLGPYFGAFAASIGGFLGWSITQTGAFSFLSFVPGATTALASGLLYNDKRKLSGLMYSTLFLALAFYPTIGPAWIYPYYLWFQLIGLIVLLSPLSLLAIKSVRQDSTFKLLSFGVAVISLISTLTGQMIGNLMFELTYWPTILPQVEYWRIAQWQLLTFVYPIERFITTFLAVLAGMPLIKAVRAYGFEMGGR